MQVDAEGVRESQSATLHGEARVASVTDAGCRCKLQWWHAGQLVVGGVCAPLVANASRPSKPTEPWCQVRSGRKGMRERHRPAKQRTV